MVEDDALFTAITSTRKESENGSLVTYDLTSGIDFSDPKKIAESLAKAFFENDAKNWFTVSGDQVDFNPTCKVRIVLAEEHGKKLEETVDDFLKDIQKEQLFPRFSQQIKDEASKSSKPGKTSVLGMISSILLHHYDMKDYDDYFRDDLFLDILDKLEIRSLNDEDLMDWKNLPL